MQKPSRTITYKLADILEVKSGYPFRGAVLEKASGSVLAVQPKAISELGELIAESLTPTELTGKRKADWLQSGDVLLINKGHRNTVAYIEQDYDKVTCAPTLYFIRPKSRWASKINMKYIAWFLSQSPSQNHFKRSAEGSNQVSLRRQVVEETLIALPPLEEQNILAQLYDDTRKEQQLLQNLIRNRQQQMTAIAQQLLAQSKTQRGQTK